MVNEEESLFSGITEYLSEKREIKKVQELFTFEMEQPEPLN